MAEEAVAAEGVAPSESVEVESPAASWTDGLNENSQGFVQNKGWESAEQMLESYQHLEKTVGAPADQVLRLPKEGDAEGWSDVYNRMGRPESPEGYKLDSAGATEDGIDFQPRLREWAHEAGLSQGQTAQLNDKFQARLTEMAQEAQSQRVEQAAADEQELRKEWGDAWDSKVSDGKRFVQAFNIDNETLGKLESALGTAGLLRLSSEIGRGLGEHSDGGANMNADAAMFGMTPAVARAKINDLTLDKEFMSQYLEGNKEALDRMTRLHAVAHPEVAGSE